ncbi:hypothetical protein EON64_10420 [archaeon]|nr:MAG: hypothetical protein EON64_10420 [archaeon]
MANRIITVGAVGRADLIAESFDSDKPKQVFTSHRGFHTITGFFQGVPVSVVAIGIGLSLMDLFVREARAIVDGPMIIVRFGTCGGIGENARPGTIIVASQGAGYITRNPDAFHSASIHEPLPEPYTLHKLVPADQILSDNLVKYLTEAIGGEHVVTGVNVTADSFYSSQGRIDDRFDDRNEGMIELIRKTYPNAQSLEMESFTLMHLALR